MGGKVPLHKVHWGFVVDWLVRGVHNGRVERCLYKQSTAWMSVGLAGKRITQLEDRKVPLHRVQ